MENTRLIIQIPFLGQAQKLHYNLDTRYPGEWEIIHGTESDTYGLCVDFRRWYTIGFPFAFAGLEGIDGLKFEDHYFLEWDKEEEKIYDVDIEELYVKGGYIKLNDSIDYHVNSRSLWYMRSNRLTRSMIARDINLLKPIHRDSDPNLIDGIKKANRRGLIHINLDQWKEFEDLLEY